MICRFALWQSGLAACGCAGFIACSLRSERSAGGGPAAAHFSCLAKKSKQKKGWSTAPTRLLPSPFGVPAETRGKWERESRFAPTPFLIHFSARFSGWAEADFASGSPAASRGLLLAFGIGSLARCLAFPVVLAKAGTQWRSSRIPLVVSTCWLERA